MIYTRIGLEVLAKYPEKAMRWGNCGLLCNQASVTANFVHAQKILQTLLGPKLKAMFGPQHGFYGIEQDNMIETNHVREAHGKLPIYSLYSETREPTEEMLQGIDTLVVDLQIVGCRIYTFKATILGCLRAAKKFNKRVVILDRPNPLGGEILEGRVVTEDTKSFVGPVVMPMRHGLSAGEAALFFNMTVGAELEVVLMESWDPTKDWSATGRPWVITSPNLPTIEPVYVYPGTVIFEGTNVSEGRGTGLPFQFIGASYITSSRALVERVSQIIPNPPGVLIRPVHFKPTSGKHSGQDCGGVQIHVTEPLAVRSYALALALLKGFMDLGGEFFTWKAPPYEYEYSKLPINIILGSLEADRKLARLDLKDPFWSEGIREYADQARSCVRYPREFRE